MKWEILHNVNHFSFGNHVIEKSLDGIYFGHLSRVESNMSRKDELRENALGTIIFCPFKIREHCFSINFNKGRRFYIRV